MTEGLTYKAGASGDRRAGLMDLTDAIDGTSCRSSRVTAIFLAGCSGWMVDQSRSIAAVGSDRSGNFPLGLLIMC